MTRITETITQVQTTTNSLRMVLRPSTLNMRNDFQNVMNNRLIENNSRLPSTPMLEEVLVIDRETVIEINNTTTSERRIELMQSIINQENINDNSVFLITQSTNYVRTYLHDLLIRSANNSIINESDLYRIGNILLYTIANMNEEGLFIRDIIQHLRTHMVMYNTNQIINILENHIPVYNNYLDSLRLATDEQLEERTQEFRQEIDERINVNRRRIMYAGLGLVGSMALTSMGLPPVGGVITRTIADVTTRSSNGSEMIRLRDLWDASLKKLLDIIEK